MIRASEGSAVQIAGFTKVVTGGQRIPTFLKIPVGIVW